eukprot:gene19789-21729_t
MNSASDTDIGPCSPLLQGEKQTQTKPYCVDCENSQFFRSRELYDSSPPPLSTSTAKTAKEENSSCLWKYFAGLFNLIGSCFNFIFIMGCANCFKTIHKVCSTESPKSIMLTLFYLLGQVLFCIALIINWHTKTQGVINVEADAVEMLFVVYMIIGILGMIVVFFKSDNRRFVLFRTNEKQASKYLMASVYAFGGGSLLMTTIFLFSFAHCKQSGYLVFLLIHVLGTNICIWINFLVEETHLYSYEPTDYELEACLHTKNNTITKLANDWQVYLTPFTMEFCIICAGLIYSMVSSMKHFPTHIIANASSSTTRQQPSAAQQLTTSQHHPRGYASLPIPPASLGADGGVGTSRSTSLIENIVIEDESKKRERWHSQVVAKSATPYEGSHPGFLCGLTVCVIMTVSALVIEKADKSSLYNSLLFHHIFLMAVSLTHIMALCIMVSCLANHEYVPLNFRSDDTLLVISFAGLFGWELLSIISAIGKLEHPEEELHEAVTILVHNVINLIACLVQCVVIIRTLRIRNRFKSNKMHLMWNIKGTNFKIRWLSQATVYLLTTNIGYWVLDSFFELKHYGDLYYPAGLKFYDDGVWHFWSALLYPLNIFFRFHSAILLVEVWVRFVTRPAIGDKEGIHEESEYSLSRKSSLPSIDTLLFTRRQVAEDEAPSLPKKQTRVPIDSADIYRKYWSQ